MFRYLHRTLLIALLAMFATQANALFLQPDWFDVTNPGVGTNRYLYSFNDPVNRIDPNGNESVDLFRSQENSDKANQEAAENATQQAEKTKQREPHLATY